MRKSLVVVVGTLVCLTIGVVVARGASPGTNPFTNAVVHFNIDNGTIESVQSRGNLPGNYVPSAIFYQFCSPPGDSETNTAASGTFDVAADGKLTGSCEATRTDTTPSGVGSAVAKQGTLSGTYDLVAQTVKFHFEGSSTYTYTQPPSCKVGCAPVTVVNSVVVDGPVSGGEVVGDRAEGTARHTYTCSPTAQCPVGKQVGVVKFAIQFLPALPTAAPGAGGGATGSDDATDLPTALIFLLLLAIVLLGLAAFKRRGSFGTLGKVGELGASLGTVVGPDPGPPASPPASPAPGPAAPAPTDVSNAEAVDGFTGLMAEGALPADDSAATVKDVVDSAGDFMGEDEPRKPDTPEGSEGR